MFLLLFRGSREKRKMKREGETWMVSYNFTWMKGEKSIENSAKNQGGWGKKKEKEIEK